MQHPQQSNVTIEGIVPVMLTPFDDAGAIDYAGLERLIEWYRRTAPTRCSRSPSRARCSS